MILEFKKIYNSPLFVMKFFCILSFIQMQQKECIKSTGTHTCVSWLFIKGFLMYGDEKSWLAQLIGNSKIWIPFQSKEYKVWPPRLSLTTRPSHKKPGFLTGNRKPTSYFSLEPGWMGQKLFHFWALSQ